MLKIAGVVLLSVLAYLLLKKERVELAFMIELGVTVLLLVMLLPLLEEIMDTIYDLFDSAALDKVYVQIPVKCVGIAILTKLLCELCRDAGENALAVKVELSAKILMLIQALPLFKELFVLIRELLERTV